MATRYYTEEAYEQIMRTIEQIDNDDVNPVEDFFDDLFQRLAQYLKFYSVDDYQNNMQNWYNKILDSHNTTISTVDSIFRAVEDVDSECQDIMDGAYASITSFRNMLNCLRDVISGKTSLADGKTAADEYLGNGKNTLNASYDLLLTKMEARALGDASKELLGDVLKLGEGFCKLFTTRDPVKFAVECKKFLDTFTATLGDLGAVLTIVVLPVFDIVGSHIGVNYGASLDFRFDQLTQAQKLKDTNSVSDWLGGLSEDLTEDLGECPKDNPYYPVVEATAKGSQFISQGSQMVDMTADLIEIGSDIKDTGDNIDEWINGKSYTPEEYAKIYKKKDFQNILEIAKGDDGMIIKAKVSPTEIISKVVSDRTGIPLSGWTDPDKSTGNVFKLAGTLWSYGEKLLPNPTDGRSNISDLPDVFFDKFKETKFVKDLFDYARDYLVTEVS